MAWASKEKERAYWREYREKNRERIRAKARKASRRWRARNPERVREQNARWRAANPGRGSELSRAWNLANREKWRAYETESRLKKYGITTAAYEAILAKQGGKCRLCGKAETATRNGRTRRLVVDHCHETGWFRSVLCANCNLGLGCFGDDPELLLAAAKFMHEWKAHKTSIAV